MGFVTDIIYEMSLIIDKFQNIVLEQTCERIISGGKIYYLWLNFCCLYESENIRILRGLSIAGKYCDVHLGVYIVRGDNITLLCEIDEDREKNEMPLEKVEPEDLPDVGEKDSAVQWNFE